MRADAQRNCQRILDAAGIVVAEQGVNASLRDVARRAGVGLGTLYRHFPTRDSLLEALIQADVHRLIRQGSDLEASHEPGEALITWLRDAVAFNHHYHGISAQLTAALNAEESALHRSCMTLHDIGSHLLERAQQAGQSGIDIDATDLFALVGALAWIYDQPAFGSHAGHLFDVTANALLGGTRSMR